MSKARLNETIIKMKNELKKMRMCSKKRVLRLIKTGVVGYKDGVFLDKESKEPLKGIQYKKKYLEDEDGDDEDEEDEIDPEYDLAYEDFFEKPRPAEDKPKTVDEQPKVADEKTTAVEEKPTSTEEKTTPVEEPVKEPVEEKATLTEK